WSPAMGEVYGRSLRSWPRRAPTPSARVEAPRSSLGGVLAGISTMTGVLAPPDGSDWLVITSLPLSVDTATTWATTVGSGAVVCFLGIVREHSEGRSGVRGMTYEAYEEEVTRRFAEIADETRQRWPDVERLA